MIIIAIDGPAAGGKGTLSARIATHLGYGRLDSGKLYRATAAYLMENGQNPDDVEAATHGARQISAKDLENPALVEDPVALVAAKIAAYGPVRAELLKFQQDFAKNPEISGSPAPGAVIDGRDIGTVVCPEADVKLFVTADLEVRAARRLKELRDRGEGSIKADVLQDMRVRDARDMERSESPLRQAADAHLLDTTGLNADQAFEAALKIITAIIGVGGRKSDA